MRNCTNTVMNSRKRLVESAKCLGSKSGIEISSPLLRRCLHSTDDPIQFASRVCHRNCGWKPARNWSRWGSGSIPTPTDTSTGTIPVKESSSGHDPPARVMVALFPRPMPKLSKEVCDTILLVVERECRTLCAVTATEVTLSGPPIFGEPITPDMAR